MERITNTKVESQTQKEAHADPFRRKISPPI